jgi:hypothetical protein
MRPPDRDAASANRSFCWRANSSASLESAQYVKAIGTGEITWVETLSASMAAILASTSQQGRWTRRNRSGPHMMSPASAERTSSRGQRWSPVRAARSMRSSGM